MKTCPKCGELVGDNVNRCFSCNFIFNGNQEEYRKAEGERIRKEQEAIRIKKAEIMSLNDLYEYDTVCVRDSNTGLVNIQGVQAALTEHAKEGWKLVSSFASEIGHNTSSAGIGGLSTGTNATIDNTVLIFERCIKRYKN